MILKKSHKLLVILTLIIYTICVSTSIVHAQKQVTIEVVADKSEYQVGELIKVTILAKNTLDLYGLQFTMKYNPSYLEMQGDGIILNDGYLVFGGITLDRNNGILTYPVINSASSNIIKEVEYIGYVTFKAMKPTTAQVDVTNVKGVNSNSQVITNNTQASLLFQVVDKKIEKEAESTKVVATPTKPENQTAKKYEPKITDKNESKEAYEKEQQTTNSSNRVVQPTNSIPNETEINLESEIPNDNELANDIIETTSLQEENKQEENIETLKKNTVDIKKVLYIILMIQLVGTAIYAAINRNLFIDRWKRGNKS